MTVLSLWKAKPELLHEKSVKQIIAIAGRGKLTDGSDTSLEFQSLLVELPSALLVRYAEECLSDAFPDSGLALQDVINEVGRRLGFSVTNGRYRGKTGAVGNDGLWILPNGHRIVLEVKTTDAYRIDLNVVAEYRRELIRQGEAAEDRSSVLIVVGRADTGDLEAQLRGSRYAWEMRLISVDALLRLMRVKESVEDPNTLRRIYEILAPREFTKLDEIVDLVFSTAEDAKGADATPADAEESEEEVAPDAPAEKKFTPVAFNERVADRVAKFLGVPLLKRTRALFSSPDEGTRVLCAASRQYDAGDRPGYWFAFHPHQKEVLDGATAGYAAFGCGSPDFVLCVPVKEFSKWLDGMNMTIKEDRRYWHVQIHMDDGKPHLVRKKGQPRIDLSAFRLGEVK
jgi:hypothetical protein